MLLLGGALAADALEPASPRAMFNDGTARLNDGKLREAEAALQQVVARNVEPFQTRALYNLGHVRFRQGAEALQEMADSGAAASQGTAASGRGARALTTADAALAGSDLDAILGAYLEARGARKDLKTAMEAVKRALETYGVVLGRWRRAAGDFKSAFELRPADADAKHNADVVDRHINDLVDRLNQMQMMMQGMGDQRDELREKQQQLRGRLPEGVEPQGMGEEDDDEDGQPRQPQAGTQQPPSRDGREAFITPEDAARLLETLRLDGNRKLPVGAGDQAQPKPRTGKSW